VKFGDTSVEKNIKLEEELKTLDEMLKKRGLERLKIPKDGACMFRAVADQISLTQSTHLLVRQRCVDFISKHRDDYEPFVCVSGMPWDHYLFEMRKVNSWGGQVELQALSLTFNINIIIYSIQTKEPTIVDNGFSKSIELAYYGNHYDCVYPSKKLQQLKSMQSVVYALVDKAQGKEPKQSYEYKNNGWDCWIKELITQQKEDETMAHSLSDRSNVTDYQLLSGYYNKKHQQQQDDGEWHVKLTKSNRNKKKDPKEKENITSPQRQQQQQLPAEDKDMQDILNQIRVSEIKERQNARRPAEEYPTLPPVQNKVISTPATVPNGNPEGTVTDTPQPTEKPATNAWTQKTNWTEMLNKPSPQTKTENEEQNGQEEQKEQQEETNTEAPEKRAAVEIPNNLVTASTSLEINFGDFDAKGNPIVVNHTQPTQPVQPVQQPVQPIQQPQKPSQPVQAQQPTQPVQPPPQPQVTSPPPVGNQKPLSPQNSNYVSPANFLPAYHLYKPPQTSNNTNRK